MDDSEISEPKKKHGRPPVPDELRKRVRNYSLSDRDVMFVDWLAEFLGCTKSEVVRRAVTSLVTQLAQVGFPGTMEVPEGIPERPRRGRPPKAKTED